jgi:cyclopropane-fatty-acyl-phospholipid synthase
VHAPDFFERVLAFGNLGLGESFMEGGFETTRGRLEDLLTLLLRSRLDEAVGDDPRALAQAVVLRGAAALRGRRTNVQAHYDLGNDLFELFLDESLTYSCGYSEAPGQPLEVQQANKLRRICRKLRLEPGHRLLDIGCGFGSLLLFAAREHGVRGVGVTNSERHATRARARVSDAGLSGRITIERADFTEACGRFDRVVSVGMMEHVPRVAYGQFFRTIKRSLVPGGLALIHTIGCNAKRNRHDPFIQKYVFPGSSQPRLSEIAAYAEKSGLAIADVENMVRHYEWTLRQWLERFRTGGSRLDAAKYDRRFRRMWEYYLSAGVAAAAASDAALYQVLLMEDARAAMPLVRV